MDNIVLNPSKLGIVRLIHNLDKSEFSLLNNRLKSLKLSNIQALVIIFLKNNMKKEIYQKDLEKEFGVTNPTMTVSLKSMQSKGLLLKEKSSNDRRFYKLALTSKGQLLYPKCLAIYTEIEALHKTVLSDHEYSVLSKLIVKLTNTLKDIE